ncbi:MAG: rhodanese-like domain-containing protein [Pelovirga sp.]
MTALTIVVLLLALSATAAELPTHPDQVERLNVMEVQQLQSQETVLFIDTRTPGQWQGATNKIPGAMRITTQAELDRFKQDVPPGTAIVTYCT